MRKDKLSDDIHCDVETNLFKRISPFLGEEMH